MVTSSPNASVLGWCQGELPRRIGLCRNAGPRVTLRRLRKPLLDTSPSAQVEPLRYVMGWSAKTYEEEVYSSVCQKKGRASMSKELIPSGEVVDVCECGVFADWADELRGQTPRRRQL